MQTNMNLTKYEMVFFVFNFFFCFLMFFAIINISIGSSYLYLGAKPETASLMDFFPEWPWHFFILQGLLLLIMIGMYLPFRKSDPRLQTAAA